MKKLNYKVSPKITPEDLMKYGFHLVNLDTYVYKVPCYKYNNQPTIFLEIHILYDVNNKKDFANPTLRIDCKDRNNNFYVPFYDENYFNKNLVLDKVNKKLSLVMSDMCKKGIIVKNKIKRKNSKQTGEKKC